LSHQHSMRVPPDLCRLDSFMVTVAASPGTCWDTALNEEMTEQLGHEKNRASPN